MQMETTRPTLDRSVVLAGLLVVVSVALSLVSRKILAADGVSYLFNLVRLDGFFLVGWHRHHAQYLTQILPVIGAELGAHAGIVEFLYSANVFLCFFGSVALSAYICRNHAVYFLIYAISIVAISVFSDYIIMGEHQILVLFSWPILLFALLPSSSVAVRLAILCCAIIVLRCYEAAAVVQAAPLAVCLLRTFEKPQTLSERLYWLGLCGMLLLGMLIGADGILNPRDAGNMSGFAASAAIPLSTPISLATLTFLVPFCLAAIVSSRVLAVACLLVSLPLLAWSVRIGGTPDAWQSFSGRNMTVTVLPLLMAVCAAVKFFGRRPSPWVNGAGLVFLSGLVIAYGLGQGAWRNGLTTLQERLGAEPGLIAYEDAGLDEAQFFPYWTLPTLSIILQAECVRSIVQVPEGHPWQPFDPEQERPPTPGVAYDQAVGEAGC